MTLRPEPGSAPLRALQTLAHPSVPVDGQARLYGEDPGVNALNPAAGDASLGLRKGDPEGLESWVAVRQLVNPKPGRNREKGKLTNSTTHFSLFGFEESQTGPE